MSNLYIPDLSTDEFGEFIVGVAANFDRIGRSINSLSMASGEQRLGAHWDKEPSPILTRTHNADGLVANIGVDGEWVRNDFDSLPIFGELGESVDELGNVFIRIPKFYIRKSSGLGFKTPEVRKNKQPGFYLPWCFWDFEKGVELPYIDYGKYKGSLLNGKLASVPDTHPLISTNIVQMRNYAKANNVGGLKGYQQLDIHAYDVLQTLMFVEFATLNMQSVMPGFTSGAYSAAHTAALSESGTNQIIVTDAVASSFRVGQSIGIGSGAGSNSVTGSQHRVITDITDAGGDNSAIVFDGSPVNISEGDVISNRGWTNGFSRNIASSSGCIGANDGKYPCSYRGLESPYGDIWQFVDGINIDEHQVWVCNDAEQYASNFFASPYVPLNYINRNENGYVKQMGFDPSAPFAEFPIEVGGAASTYYSDYYYQTTGQRIALVGGGWNNGLAAGPSYWNLSDSSSNAHVGIGGRLLKKPL